MTAAALDNEITSYLPLLNESQKAAILTVMKTFTQQPPSDDYDEEFTEELNQRFTDYESGNITGFTLEESEERARTYRANKK